MQVHRSDTLIIAEDTAWIISSLTWQTLGTLRDRYVQCLNKRGDDLQMLRENILVLNAKFEELDKLVRQSEKISDEVLIESAKVLTTVLIELEQNITSLEKTKETVDETIVRLDKINMQIKEERRKNFWRNSYKICVAGIVGLACGIILF